METAFYISIALFSCLYILGVIYLRHPLVSFSNINYAFMTLLGTLFGYETASGTLMRSGLYRGFDTNIYWLVIAYQALVTVGVLIGIFLGQKYKIHAYPRSGFRSTIWILAGFIIAYSAGYLVWVKDIPLLDLLLGKLSYSEAASLRIEITHRQSYASGDIPFIFRYWRNFLQFWSVCTFLIILGLHRHRIINVSRSMLFCLFLGVCFLLTFTLEKAYVIQFVFACAVMTYVFGYKRKISHIAVYVLISLVFSAVLAAAFMGTTGDELWKNLTHRGQIQTSSIYLQIEEVYQRGFLGFEALQFPLKRLIYPQASELPLSSVAYSLMFPENAKNDIIGSAGNLAIVELFIAFGWYCIPIACILVLVYGFTDRILINTIQDRNTDVVFKCISASYYIFFSLLFSMTFLTSLLQIFSIPFGLSPQAIIVLFPIVLFVDFSSIKITSTT